VGQIYKIPAGGDFGGDSSGFLGESPFAVQVKNLTHEGAPSIFFIRVFIWPLQKQPAVSPLKTASIQFYCTALRHNKIVLSQ
jgi:hypothetical protein